MKHFIVDVYKGVYSFDIYCVAAETRDAALKFMSDYLKQQNKTYSRIEAEEITDNPHLIISI